MARRSRRAGKGSITSYTTKAGTRWRYQIWVPIDPENPDEGERQTGKAGYPTAADADDALTKAKNEAAAGLRVDNTKITLGPYAQQWLDSHRIANTTREQYQRHITLHIAPALGTIAIRAITATRIAKLYRDLEDKGLGTNTIRKIHVTLTQILDAAVADRHVLVNRARTKAAKPPTMKQAKEATDEYEAWTAAQLSAFLAWNRDIYSDELHALWHTMASTGIRRSEALALRWTDINLTEGCVIVRRALDSSVTGKGTVKGTKTGRTRRIDIDNATIDSLKAHRAARGSMAFALARGDALVFGNDAGEPRNVRGASTGWTMRVRRARAHLGEDALPILRLHGLRHTHATLLIAAGESIKVVQERLGHASISVTMDIYSHVIPGQQKSAAERFAALLS
ncbi:site-specific integrase [Rhodococcus erythropolis]|jgi:integrase|uniref:tyrosine-type recombinase/integrase n=1 Tax=Rhodococcus erythropolis TaxID=1833 RepID=UPI001244E490|nr:site-specific integrase [Rhodococcus erythropolis]QEX12128.1 site-specific integrase [Rhodococcus erythropolis]